MKRFTRAFGIRCIASFLLLSLCVAVLFSCKAEDVELLDHNPYYDAEVPDSVFKTPTDEWREFKIKADGFPLTKYYTYSFKQKSSENIVTYIIKLYLRNKFDMTGREYTENGKKYVSASATLEMSLAETPRTVVYYPEKDRFSFDPNGDEKVRLGECTIEFKKASSGVPHVLVSRYSYGDATSNSGFLGLGELGLGALEYLTLDSETYSFGAFVDTKEIRSYDPYAWSDTLSSDAMYQKQCYGAMFGGVRSTLGGYLEKSGHHFCVDVRFAVPNEYRDAVFDIDCDFSVTPEIK